MTSILKSTTTKTLFPQSDTSFETMPIYNVNENEVYCNFYFLSIPKVTYLLQPKQKFILNINVTENTSLI